MLSRRVSGLLVSVVALGVWLPVTASPGFADDAGATVTIASPDQFAAGEQAVITVDAHTAAPVGPDDFVFLDVILPPRLVADSVQATGFACSVLDNHPGQDVECPGSGFTDSGSVQVTVTAEPGTEEFETVRAQFQTSAGSVESDKTVDIAPTPSGISLVVSAPASVRSGDEFPITVTASADHPLVDSVVIDVGLFSARLTPVSAAAPGFTCTVNPPQFGTSEAACDAGGLADTVTMTVMVTAGPGSSESAGVQTVLFTPGSVESTNASILVFGDNLTTVSGRVWNDLNRDGRQDPTEPGIAGISVTSQFSGTTTDEDGRYELTDLERGDTGILFVAPGRFDFTRPNVGDDRRDSDVTLTERDCEDCVAGTVLLAVTGPTGHVDAGLFDPAVPVRAHRLTLG